MPSALQRIGQRAEEKALRQLEKLGYRFVERHWTCRFGEIDLIMKDGQELVFVEVKMRSSTAYGHPEDMISFEKKRRLLKTALCYITDKGIEDIFWRFDTMAITGDGHQEDIQHFTDTIRIDR